MRKYRMGLIQTPDQLRFSYLAILEGARALSCCQQKDAHPTVDERVIKRSPERNGITEESSDSEATDSSDDEDEGDDEDTMGGGKYAGENGEGSSRLLIGAGDSPPPLPPRLKRSSEENSNSSSEAKDLLAGEPGALDIPPRKSTGEEAELRRRQRRERVERTSQMVQRMRQKQRSSETWAQRGRLLKHVSIGLVLLLGTGVLVYKYYEK
uniref:protein-tyrosine-phosphatase n=2 Tax=Rhipicephalus microplus TaxID=6941 RepID=A0A6M2CR66_RHIMP